MDSQHPTPPLAGVIGSPVRHSLSPAINRFWREAYDIQGQFISIEVPDTEDAFELHLRALAMAGFVGVNVTLPHKHRACSLAPTRSGGAEAVNAANMVTFTTRDPKGFEADNSDIAGFAAALSSLPSARIGKNALVLGAGGAAGAIVLALFDCGLQTITIANRTASKAADLCARLGSSKPPGATLTPVPWEDRHASPASLVVNTTSLGMTGQNPLPFEIAALKNPSAVVDIIYSPLPTALLRDAQQRGLATVDGLDMLMHQAVPGFARWFGKRPDVTLSLRDHLTGLLTKKTRKTTRYIALTGSIGMGKSTVLKMFADAGCAVWDADQAVHDLYGPGGRAVSAIGTLYPDTVSAKGVDRARLGQYVLGNPEAMAFLEAMIHPLVAADRQRFSEAVEHAGAELIVFDIPLLLEKNQKADFDAVLVVSAGPDVQRARVLARPGMTEEKFVTILSRQMPDSEKRQHADFVIENDSSLENTRQQVVTALEAITERFQA